MSSQYPSYFSGSQPPRLWQVPTCDPELRVVAPGQINLPSNQEPRKAWISIPQRGHGESPNTWWSVPTASFLVLSSGSHRQDANFLPLPPDPQLRLRSEAGQPMEGCGHSRASLQGQAGQGEEAPWSISCPLPCSKPPVPRPWGVNTEAVSSTSCPAAHPAAL